MSTGDTGSELRLLESGDDQLKYGDDVGALDDMDGGGGPDRDWIDDLNGFDVENNDYGQRTEKEDPRFSSDGFSNVPTTAQTMGESPIGGFSANSTGTDWIKADWPQKAAKPVHQAQWEANTLDHLSHAKMLVRQAQKHAKENDKHIHGARRRHHNQVGTVQNVMKKKISQTSDLIKALEDRHESLEDTIRQVGECLFQLQRAHRSKWAPLNVCERRLELRDTRPLQELIRDHTQEALEHERQTLIESRQELNDQIQSSKEMLLDLDKTKNSVIEDLSHKRHANRIDRSCLSPSKHDIMHTERVVLPQLGEICSYDTVASPKDTERGTGGTHEETRQEDTKTLIQKAVKFEEAAMRLCNDSDAVMLQTKRECTRAANQAQAALAKRADETDDLKRKLEAQMRELDEAIAQTEMSLGRTKKKLEFHETPLKTLDKQFDLRTRRTEREGIRDDVHEELETQLELVKKNVRTLTQKFQDTKFLLDHLKESRKQLTEDYRRKLLALKIEDACLKVTARKAIELNRSDPRGGRCRVPSSARRPKREANQGVNYGGALDF